MDSSSSFLIAWELNDNTTHTLLLSIKHILAFIRVCFVFYSTSTKALFHINANDELTARVAKMVALLNLCHCPSQSCSKTKWRKFLLRSAPSSDHLCHQPLQWFWRHCRPTRSRHCRPARSTAETFKLNPFQPCATRIYLPKGTAKEQEHGRKSYKVFSLNPLYQIEEEY